LKEKTKQTGPGFIAGTGQATAQNLRSLGQLRRVCAVAVVDLPWIHWQIGNRRLARSLH